MGNIFLDLFKAIISIFDYILTLRIVDIPYFLATIGVSALLGYISALILIGFPCSIWEAVRHRKIIARKEEKVTKIVAICLFVVFLLKILYERSLG